jgi:hypothetical protein
MQEFVFQTEVCLGCSEVCKLNSDIYMSRNNHFCSLKCRHVYDNREFDRRRKDKLNCLKPSNLFTKLSKCTF